MWMVCDVEVHNEIWHLREADFLLFITRDRAIHMVQGLTLVPEREKIISEYSFRVQTV